MLRKFLPRQEGFFELFQKNADLLVKATQQYSSMLNNLNDLQTHAQAIANYERQGDHIAHTTFELLHKTFITPFDRNDIHELTSGLDDILDQINRCAQRFPFYHLQAVPQEIFMLAELAAQSASLLKNAVAGLDSLKNSEHILINCEGVCQLEGEADLVLLSGMSKLFQDEEDFKAFIRMKEIYEHTKAIIDSCQDVANIIKGIVLEYS